MRYDLVIIGGCRVLPRWEESNSENVNGERYKYRRSRWGRPSLPSIIAPYKTTRFSSPVRSFVLGELEHSLARNYSARSSPTTFPSRPGISTPARARQRPGTDGSTRFPRRPGILEPESPTSRPSRRPAVGRKRPTLYSPQ